MDLQISAYLFKSSILSHWISGQLLALGTWVKNKTIDKKPLSSIILQDKNLELILFISQKNRTTQQYTAIEIISIFFFLYSDCLVSIHSPRNKSEGSLRLPEFAQGNYGD